LNIPYQRDPLSPVRAAIWVYFWLLLWEGALRKWVFPEYSNALFIIRDPVAVVAYVLAARAGVFPRNVAILFVAILAFFSLVFAALGDTPGDVMLFGLRTDYLHLPLIFIMGQVLNRDHVVRLGRWFLIMSVPICALMVAQFDARPDDWINLGAGGVVGGQIRGAMDKIRPPGPFSFISGPVLYFSLVAAFAGYGWVQPGRYSRVLLLVATAATIVAIPVSISRSLLLAVLTVVGFAVVAAMTDLRRLPRYLGPLVAACGFLAFASDSIYIRAFVVRWNESLQGGFNSGYQTNVFARIWEPLVQPFAIAADVPFWGYGIGVGTAAGARLLTGKATFLLGESELARIVLELGPVLGFAFIAWRAWLALALISRGWQQVLARGDVLAWLITGATFFNVLSGQWGPATQLGFAVFGAGLALGAMNDPPEAETMGTEAGDDPVGEGGLA
jgi:hypothetical protein